MAFSIRRFWYKYDFNNYIYVYLYKVHVQPYLFALCIITNNDVTNEEKTLQLVLWYYSILYLYFYIIVYCLVLVVTDSTVHQKYVISCHLPLLLTWLCVCTATFLSYFKRITLTSYACYYFDIFVFASFSIGIYSYYSYGHGVCCSVCYTTY